MSRSKAEAEPEADCEAEADAEAEADSEAEAAADSETDSVAPRLKRSVKWGLSNLRSGMRTR